MSIVQALLRTYTDPFLDQALAKKLGLPDSFYHQMMSGGFGGGSPGPAQQTSAPPPQEAEQPV